MESPPQKITKFKFCLQQARLLKRKIRDHDIKKWLDTRADEWPVNDKYLLSTDSI